MSRSVILRPEARAEFDEAFDYYEEQQPGLGVDFAAKVQDVFDQIADRPELFAKVHGDIRLAVVKRFPFVVPYQLDDSEIVILAVFHGRRDPGIWQSRQ